MGKDLQTDGTEMRVYQHFAAFPGYVAAPSSSGYTLPACCSQTTQRGSGWQAWIEVCFLLYGAGPEVSGPSPSTFLIPLDWGLEEEQPSDGDVGGALPAPGL